ncbi:hypothetical protein H2200_010894 [Cladophialophora chaetospira]|uniref:Uncharacterized protein n=1 Tax=Cladophialophora chaetospira TaxID=386627 RepID=A0AA38X0Z0_9EURO|nr:hypothetical protein H2200_010894 [Cladophialophora chaetospira]
MDTAIKDCVVSLTITSLERAPKKNASALESLRSSDYYYFRAAGLLSRQHEKLSMELSLIASVAFWHIDFFTRRPLRAMIHLLATTKLWRTMQRSTLFSTSLIAAVEQLLCNLAGIEFHHESNGSSLLLPSPEAHCKDTDQATYPGFPSLNAARASLSRCIWAAVLAYDPSATALQTRSRTDLEYIVFDRDLTRVLDFSDPPFCTLSDCLGLFASWYRRLSLTSEACIPVAESQSLQLNAELIRATIQKDVNNSKKDSNACEEDSEALFVRMLDDIADMIRKAERSKHFHSAADETISTSLRAPLCFIQRRTKVQETLVRALELMQKDQDMNEGNNTVVLMWMGFIAENDLLTGPPVG